MNFADPKNDVAFKKIFGDENKKEILISFLNNILDFVGTDKEIVDISIVDPYQAPKLADLKNTFLDIKAVDKRGIHYIVEMQVIHAEAFEKKVLYYVSKAYVHQLERGDDYPALNQVIFLGFLNFKLFKENKNYATRHLILDEETNEHLFKDFDLNFIELPKFKKSLEELANVKDKWIYFVKNAGSMSLIPGEMKEPKELRDAFEIANQHTWTQQELDIYEAKGVFITTEKQVRLQAHKEGHEEGHEEGHKEGLIDGEKIGIEKGMEKGKELEKLEIAKAMLAEGLPIEIIIKTTGLSKEKIQG